MAFGGLFEILYVWAPASAEPTALSLEPSRHQRPHTPGKAARSLTANFCSFKDQEATLSAEAPSVPPRGAGGGVGGSVLRAALHSVEGWLPGQAASGMDRFSPLGVRTCYGNFFFKGGSGYWGVFGTSCLGILEPGLSLHLGLLGRGLGTGVSLGHWRFLSPTLLRATGDALVFTPNLKSRMYWLFLPCNLGTQRTNFESYEQSLYALHPRLLG